MKLLNYLFQLITDLFNMKILTILITLITIGNLNAQYTWNTVRIGGGGAVPGMIAHPKVKDLFYCRTDVGNCYRWDGTGQKWVGLLNSVKNSESWLSSAADIAIDPSDISGKTLYITVGKYDWAGNGGVWKSGDGGTSWSRLNLNITVGSNQDQLVGQRLAVSPLNSSIIILTTKSDGTYRSINGGLNWTNVTATNGTFVLFDPVSSNIVYIGHSGGVIKSIDGGANFSPMAGAPSLCRRASIHNSGIMYVTTETGVSKWNGSSWSAITPGGTNNVVFGAVCVNPQNANQVLVSKHAWKDHLDMYRSSDGGTKWTLINNQRDVTECPWEPEWHFAASTFELCWDPFNQNHIWFTDWYSTWETNDPWASNVIWKARAVGHEEIVTTGMLACPPNGDIVLLSGVADVGGFDHTSLIAPPSQNIWKSGLPSGMASTGVAFQETNTKFIARVGRIGWDGSGTGGYSTNGGLSYNVFESIPGDGGRIAISATNNTMVWATQGGNTYYSTNNGTNWNASAGLPSLIGGSNIFTYIQPLAADKVNGNKFYAYNNGKFYRSSDGGITFSVVNSSLPKLDNNDFVNLVTVPGEEGVIYLGLNESGLYRSSNGGTNFTKLTLPTTASLIAVGKSGTSNNATVFIYGTVNGLDGVFRSEDNGLTWTEISTAEYQMGDEPNSMAADRNIFGRIFIGTNGNGIYYGEPQTPIVTPPVTTTFSGYYKLTAKHSGKSLDVNQSSTADGGIVQQWTDNGGDAQKWLIEDAGGGYYSLKARCSGKALDVTGGPTATGNGVKVQQWTYGGGDNQKWKIDSVGGGYYKLTAKHSGKCLDISGGSGATGDGVKANQWDYWGGDNQKWALTYISATGARESSANGKKVENIEPALTNFNVYPNPSNGIANISYTATHTEQIAIHLYDTQGRLVKTIFNGAALKGVEQNYPVDGSSLREGLYIIKLKTSSETINKKVIFNK